MHSVAEPQFAQFARMADVVNKSNILTEPLEWRYGGESSSSNDNDVAATAGELTVGVVDGLNNEDTVLSRRDTVESSPDRV